MRAEVVHRRLGEDDEVKGVIEPRQHPGDLLAIAQAYEQLALNNGRQGVPQATVSLIR